MIAVGTLAQDATVTTTRHSNFSSFETKVRNAEVVYVEGNNLVLRADGKLEHLVVPDTDKFHVDGREVSVYDLKPGTKLTETIVTKTTPRYVNSVRTIKGEVWHVTPPDHLILTLPDNQRRAYTVPKDAKFTVDGQENSVSDLRKGMQVEATVVQEETQSVVQQSKIVTGQAPPTPETPQKVGTLLIQKPPESSTATIASSQQPSQELPQTGSFLPLIGLLGLIAVAGPLGLKTLRKFVL